MKIELNAAQSRFIGMYLARHVGLSAEDAVGEALKLLEAHDGFDMAKYFAAAELRDIRDSIAATQAEPYFTSADMWQWLESLGQVFHECA